MKKGTLKYTNHTKEDVAEYLNKVKKCVSAGKFIVSMTEKNYKNILFIEKYKLDKCNQKKMLMELDINDFCYSADNYNDPQERLYFFLREYELNNWGTIEKVNVYIKTALKNGQFVVVVSFHEPEKNMKKLFV